MEIRVESAAARQAARRSGVYALLARAFAFPSEAFHDELTSGRYRKRLHQASEDLPRPLEIGRDLGRDVGASYDDFEASYIAHFEVGGPAGPVVPLYEGHYGGGLLRDMEEVLRLYHHFGFRYTGGFRPDHLQTELEFLHALTFAEAAAAERGGAVELYCRAQRDFVRFHFAGLAAQVAQGLAGRSAAFYPEISRLLAAFAASEAS